MLFWNSCGVWLPAAKLLDSQYMSLVKKKRCCLLKVIQIEKNGIVLPLSFTPFKTTPKHTVLLPFAISGQFQNTPIRGTVFQKSRSLQLSTPGHSSAPSISHSSGCLCRSRTGLAGPAQVRRLLQADSNLGSCAGPPLHLQLWPLTRLLAFRPSSSLTPDPVASPLSLSAHPH